MLTPRGRLALLLAAGMYLAAWALGTREAYAPAVGLAIGVGLAVLYVRLVRGPFRLVRRGGPGEHVEGGELSVRVEVHREGGLPPVGARLFDTLPAVGEAQVPLFSDRDLLLGRYTLRGLPRGRYRLDKAKLVVDDPFGLARNELELPATGAIVVYPRIYELDRLFPEGGGPNGMSGRYLLARGAGFDLHSVRDHQNGESLRRVHWRSTARRQKLMVKELEDAPRDEAAVVLDARAGLVAGKAPDSSFEMMVRATGSILRRLAADGRRSALVVSGARLERTPVTSLEGDWRIALEQLATVQPDGRRALVAALEDGRAGLDASRLFLVTADLSPQLEQRLSLVAGRREVALVWVDPRTWADRVPAPGASDGIALALQRRGVAVVRVRRGDDLAAVLQAGVRTAGHAPKPEAVRA
jgi:uncharacterized protein (DUF58 family)